jgi:hypothetical protein
MKAFDLTQPTVSLLKRSLDGSSEAYSRVRRRFAELGEEAFVREYYDQALHLRLKRIELEHRGAVLESGDLPRPRHGANPRAYQYARIVGPFRPLIGDGPDERYQIMWIQPTPRHIPGWYGVAVLADGSRHPDWLMGLQGGGQRDEDGLELPGKKSSVIFDLLHLNYNVPNPRGRARNLG